jgi:LacI family transcriptional regulator
VLNGKEQEMRISAELATKVRATAKDEGYRPNKVAVSLRTGKSNIIGLIVDTISGHFFASLARVIEVELEHFGFKVIYCSTGNNSDKGAELIQMLTHYQVDGYLITPAEGMERQVETLKLGRKPVVLIDSYFPDTNVPYVLSDNFDGVCKAMQYLTGRGYKKIGFVYNDVSLVQMQQRKRAYTETLQNKGLPAEDALLLKTRYQDSQEQIIRQINAFLKSRRPEAVLFAANYLGVYGLNSIRQLGLSIPNDIAVVCFDDHELFSLYPPGITAIRQPIEEIAKTAVAILMSEMGQSDNTCHKKQVKLPAKLIERNSA